MEHGAHRVAPAFGLDCARSAASWKPTFAIPTPSAGTPFPFPTLTEKNKADLTRCAEDILLAREAHFPATIADLYDPDNMPADLREAHERNDEVLERIYIGRRFRNDTERLEKLFELYTKMTAAAGRGQEDERRRQAHDRRNEISSLRFGFLRPQRQLDQGQCAWHAADAGARL